MEHITGNNRVCFEVDLPIAYVRSLGIPCKADYLYRSVIIKGRAHIVSDKDERSLALQYLMTKYQPEGGYGGFPEDKLQLTAIVRIDIEEITGKEDLGKDSEREVVLNIVKSKGPTAIVLERK